MAGDLHRARTLIGITLLCLLSAIVLLGFASLLSIDAGLDAVNREVIAAVKNKDDAERLAAVVRLAADQSKADADRLALLLNIVFGPVVTLLGSVTGFYFGSRTARDSR